MLYRTHVFSLCQASGLPGVAVAAGTPATASYRLLMDPKTGRIIGSIPATSMSSSQAMQTVTASAAPIMATALRPAMTTATAAGGRAIATTAPQV